MDEHARAWLDGDESAYLAGISSRARDFRADQKKVFQWSRDVDFASYDLEAQWENGDLVRPSDRASYDDVEDVSIAIVTESYEIEGFDVSPAFEDYFITFVKQDDEWLIASDSDLQNIGLRSTRHLWHFGPIETTRSEHFLLLSHPCDDCGEELDELLEVAESGLRRSRRFWPLRWNDRVVIFVPETPDELARMLQLTFRPEDFVAFAIASVDDRRDIDYTAPRIVFNLDSLSDRSLASVTETFAHELLHVATRYRSGPFIPVFIEEGFADYGGADADPEALYFLSSELSAGVFDRALPSDHQFSTGGATAIFRSYQKSHSAVKFFIERYGLKKFLRFYRTLGKPGIVAGSTRYFLNRALRRTIGVGFDSFERAWADTLAS